MIEKVGHRNYDKCILLNKKIYIYFLKLRHFINLLRKAFTLIELLIVIAIIAILAGLLLPALKSAKEMGRSIVCINNEKQMLLAFQMYADEHNGAVAGGGSSNWWLSWDRLISSPYLQKEPIYYIKGQGGKWEVCPSDRLERADAFGNQCDPRLTV